MNQAQHRPKDLGVGEFAGGGHAIEHRRLHEVASLVLRNSWVAAVEHDFGAIFRAHANQALDAVFALASYDRAHLYPFVEAVADAQIRRRLGNGAAKRLLCFANGYRDRDGQAALASASKGAVGDDLRRHLHVRVRQDDDVILRSTLALRPLTIRACARVNVFRDGGRADETDGAHCRMIEQRIDRNFAAVHQVDHALRNAGFFQQFEGKLHGERDAFRRLDDQRVPTGDGIRQEPERNHPWKIKRSHGSDYAEWLTDHDLVDAPRHIFQVVALHHGGNPAGHFDILDGAPHLGFRFGECLTIFLRDDPSEVVDVLFEQHLQLEKRLD